MSVGDHRVYSLMMKGGHGQTHKLHDINWGTLDHASHAPQLMSCNYSVLEHVHYVYVRMYMHTQFTIR